MRAQFCFYLIWGLFFHCCGEPGSQKQWLNSVTPVITPLYTSNIPWLVSITKTCQGIILNQWWILSTARCLTKLKHLQYDISVVSDQESNLLGHKICLYPSFDPHMEADSVKQDIGMVLLQYPLKRKEMSISHTYNFFWKSCYNCHLRHCRIYKYQNQHNFPTQIKKLAVKILDVSFCYHQHVRLSRSKNLCILIQPQQDCWVQQGSPLLCHFGSHWKLIGLVSESSVTCYYPILVIKTTPYLSWMRWIIKTSQKPLKPIFSLPCTIFPRVEYKRQDKLSLNRDATNFFPNGSSIQSWRLNTSFLNRKRRNSPEIFGSNIRDSFSDNRQLFMQSSYSIYTFPDYIQMSQLHSDIKFPVTQSQVYSNNFPFYSHLSSSPWLEFFSDVTPWPYSKPDKTVIQIQINKKSTRTQVHLVDGRITNVKPVLYTMHPEAPTMVNKIEIWTHSALFADGTHYPTITHALESWFHPILNIVGSHNILDKISENLNVPVYKTNLFKISSAIFMPFTRPISVDTTLSTPKMESLPHYKPVMTKYSNQMQIINSMTKHEINILKTPQIQIEDKIMFLINTISNVPLPFSHTKIDLIKPLVPSEAEIVKTWASNPTGIPVTLLKKDIIWPWLHPRIKRLRPWIQPKFQMNIPTIQTAEIKDNYWIQAETHNMKPWTYNQMERITHWNQLENIGRTWLFTKYDSMKPMTQTYFKTLHYWTEPDVNTWSLPEIIIQSWPKPETSMLRTRTIFEMDIVRKLLKTKPDTMRASSQLDLQTFLTLYELEPYRISPWLHTQTEAFKSYLETNLQTHAWLQTEGDITRLPPQFADDNVKLWFQNQIQTVTLLTETLTQTAYHWSQSETEIGRPWNQHLIDKDKWIHGTYKVGPWDEFESEKSRFWIQPEAYTVRPWMQLENGIINPWTQSESSSIIYAQDESSRIKIWTQSESETIIPLTQMLAEMVPTWTMAEFLGLIPQVYSVSDTVTPWNKTVSVAKNIWAQTLTPGEPTEINIWTKTIANTITISTQVESLIVNSWTQSENDTLIPWMHPESLAINLWSEPIADLVTDWAQSDTSEIIFWTKVLTNRVIPWTQTEYRTINTWTQSEIDTVSVKNQIDYRTINSLLNVVGGTVTQLSHYDFRSVNSCLQTKADPITLCVQVETSLYSNYETNFVTTCILEESLFFRSFETDSISTWTKKRNTETNPQVQTETDIITTTWIQAENSVIKSWIQHTVGTVTPVTQTESLEKNPWKKAEYVSVTAVTQLALLGNPWTETIASIIIPWTTDESSSLDLWIQSKTDVDTPRTKTSYPGVNPWTDNILQWTHPETSALNQWSQIFISYAQAEFPPVEIRRHSVAGKVIAVAQVEYPTINLCSEASDSSFIFCPPSLILPWTVTATSNVTPMNEIEHSSINHWLETTDNTVIPCTSGGNQIHHTSTVLVPGILELLDLSTLVSVKSWPQSMTEAITQWIQNETPVYALEQSVPDSFKLLTQTFTIPVNPLTEQKSFAFTSRSKAESLNENIWLKFISETVSRETEKFSPVENLLIETVNAWTLFGTCTVILGTHAESTIVKTWTQSLATSQWTYLKPFSKNICTQPQCYAANPWTRSELPSVNVLMDFSSLAPTPPVQTESSIDISYTQIVSPSIIPWTAFITSTVITWTSMESQVVNSLTISKTDRGIHILSDDSLSFNFFKKCENDMGKIFPQIKSPVNLVSPNIVNKIRVLNHVEYLTSNYFPNTVTDTEGVLGASPTLNCWTEDLTSVVTSWMNTKTKMENMWTQSNFEIDTYMTQVQSIMISPSLQLENSASVRTPAESLVVNPWKHTIDSIVNLLTLKLNTYPQSVVSSVTSGTQALLSPVIQWPTSVASIITPWTPAEFRAVNAHFESLGTTISTLPQDDYARINHWPQIMASTVKYMTVTEWPPASIWPETMFFTLSKWISAESPTVKTWTKAVFSTFNPWIQDKFSIITLWTMAITSTVESKNEAKSQTENICLETLVSQVTQWIHDKHLTVNDDPQTISSIVRSWNIIETQTSNFWTEIITSTVTPWTQAEYLRINSLTETIVPIIEARNKNEYSTIEFWMQTLPSIVTQYAQTESLSNPLSETVTSTILSWDQAESPKENTCIITLPFKDSSWTHTLSPEINCYTQTLISTLLQGTQTLYPGYSLTLTTDDTVTTRNLVEYVTVSSNKPTITDRILLWTVLTIESKKTSSLSEASIFDNSLYSHSDVAVPLMQVKNQLSHPWTHQEIDMHYNTWTFPISGKFLSWNTPLFQENRFLPQPEAYTGIYRFEIHTDIIIPWTQSEFQIVNTFTQFGEWGNKPLLQHQIVPGSCTDTNSFLLWKNSERNTVQHQVFSESDTLGPWSQTKVGMANTWTHPVSFLIRFCTQFQLEADKFCTLSEINTAMLLTQTEMYAVKQLSIPDSITGISWFQPQIEGKRQGTQTESQIFTIWIQATELITQPVFHSETKIIELLAQPESQVAITQTEAGTETLCNPFLTETFKPWSQVPSQLKYGWSQNEISISTYWIHYETYLIRSWINIQTDIVQSTVKSWAHFITLEQHSLSQSETNAAVRHWVHTQMTSIHPWSPPEAITVKSWPQLETKTILIWTQTEKQVVKSLPLSGAIVTPYLQSQNYTIMPWIQSELSPIQPVDSELVNRVTQTELSLTVSWHLQIKPGTNNAWIYPEIQAVKPWIKLEANHDESCFHIQMTKFRPWIDLESQVSNSRIQSKPDIIHSWIQPEIQAVRTRFHSESDISSFDIPKPNNVRMMNQPETEIKYDIYYKTVITTSYNSEVEPGRAASLLTSHLTEVASSESEENINCLHPSKFTDISIFTPESSCFNFVDHLRKFDNKLQIMKTTENFYFPYSSLNPHSPSFYLIPSSVPYPCALSFSYSVFSSCIFNSFPSCHSLPPLSAFSTMFLPQVSSCNSLQVISSYNKETIVSHILSSLQASTATMLTKQTPLMPESRSGISTDQPEKTSLKYLEFNVSLAECHLGVVWKESLQAFWLFKTAVISHETTECGLRPGLVPHCPNCWEAEVGEFPWMVSVQLSFSHFCAGSILNEQWILTTARCANFIKNSEALALVQVGLNDLQDPSQAQTVGIHRVMPYFGPNGPLGPGLLFLKQPVHFQSLVLPICLEETLEQEKNIQLYDCWLPSWSLMRGSPGILQKRHLSILQVISCAQFWPKLNEFTFCVEAKKAMGEAGCKGDLGAPLVCHLQQKDIWVQVGILSHFDEHCTKPYVFSQVSPFIFWIQGVTQLSHAPWSQQGPLTTSASIYPPVSTSTNASAFSSTLAYIRPHFISLPQPQILADRISLRYAMPWQAMIISCGSQICSGSIVSSSWVLTAAHCVRNMNPEDTAVVLGLRHPGAPLRVVKVSSILLHERFRLVSGAARNDLALLLLQETQSSVQLLAPLGNLKNLNSSECWLSGPRIVKPGDIDENPEMLQIQVMGASSCAHLYPDIGSSIICFITQAKSSDINLDPVSPGSAVMCRPLSGNGSWRQIGLTSLKALATVVSPYFSWILSASEKAGHPLNQAVMPWVEKPKSSGILKQPLAMPLFTLIIFKFQIFF